MDIYAKITEEIVAAIENGAGSYQMPWHRSSGGLPSNAQTDRLYSGVNIISLWVSQAVAGHTSDKWATYRQWQEMGAQVRKGEKSTPIVFYKELESDDEDDRRFVARGYHVFNAAQVEGYEAELPTAGPIDRLEHAEAAIKATGIPIIEQGERACYAPSRDTVYIPESWRFFDTPTRSREEAYYSVVWHELCHATGHASRLDRPLKNKFGDENYAKEELVAEIGAAFCCARLNITSEPRPDHASYIQNWLEKLKNDKRFIFRASAEAQKAVDWLL